MLWCLNLVGCLSACVGFREGCRKGFAICNADDVEKAFVDIMTVEPKRNGII